jgi:hypothetical protein
MLADDAVAEARREEYGVELARIILGHKTVYMTEIYAEALAPHKDGSPDPRMRTS